MDRNRFFLLIILLIIVSPPASALRLLFVLPCFGGHFGTMSPLITSLAYTNDVTVIGTSSLCRHKLEPLQKKVRFEVIEEDIGWGDVQIETFLDSIKFFASTATERFRAQVHCLTKFLTSEKRSDFDVMIADFTLDGALLAGEIANMPTVVLMSGLMGATENLVDKLETSMMELLIVQLMGSYQWSVLYATRNEHNLEPLVHQNNFFAAEYQARFPTLMPGSPLLYPQFQSPFPHTFIGGIRNASHFDDLSADLVQWLNQNERDVIYMSLGTLFKITEESLKDWVGKLRSQKQFRFIWYMNTDMQRSVEKLELKSDVTLYLSEFLPQFTLLGHPKVKSFVTHGGLGSLTDVVKRGKPSVCVPQSFDQPYNCKRMEVLGAGIVAQFDFEPVMSALGRIFSNYHAFASRANEMAENLESYEKREALEKFLGAVAAKGKADVVKDFGFQLCSPKCARAWTVAKTCFVAVPLLLIFLMTRVIECLLKRCADAPPGKPKLS